MTITRFVTLLRQAAVAWKDDEASSMGAALAFYTFFSLAPLLIMVIAVVSLIVGPDAAHGRILDQLRAVTGATAAPKARGIAHLLKNRILSFRDDPRHPVPAPGLTRRIGGPGGGGRLVGASPSMPPSSR